jgi:rhodanese-related sulfurtransferase
VASAPSADTTIPRPADGGASSAAHPDRLSALAAMRFLAAHPEALVLDVRNPDEWNDDLGHLEGSRQIPLPELSARMAELEAWKAKPVLVVCSAGGRSHTASVMLREAGFTGAMNLEGGLLAWRAAEKVKQAR